MGMKFGSTVVRAALLGVGGLAIAACGSGEVERWDGGDETSNDLTGTVREWAVEVSASSANAGPVTFTITNEGTIGHEFLVVKTDIADGEIPLDGDHFSEEAGGIEVIDEIGEYAKETTETLTVDLTAGKYQLVCNLPGHYEAGMHTAFTVK